MLHLGPKMVKALAHVSYRTMDARAILELAGRSPGSVDRRLVKHFLLIDEYRLAAAINERGVL